ncbi:FUSC family protein [Nonomuraea sp. MCN248]|uniref:FUSC family protein n=1 Tax=Nonomuraea corallina TaxID=2989783 RepID=A0ABT4SAZ1_9ACTN|nr:FUSC family protein [Nonomuraea corallina]MDA0634377.1 FUSC family protein [Nonomuraea corallina]
MGKPDVPAGLTAGVLMVVPLLVGAGLGRTSLGAAVTLSATLMLFPSPYPLRLLMLVRGAAVTAAGVFVWLVAAQPWLVAAGVTAAAVAGAFWPVLGTTGALACLFVGIMDDPGVGVPGLAQLIGAVWAALAVLLLGRLSVSVPPSRLSLATRARHAGRLGLLVGVSMSIMALLGMRVSGGHWVVTAILVTLRPTPAGMGTRYAQRMLGGMVGSALAALILISHPSTLVTAFCVGAAGALAHTYRAANYAYWSIWMPVMVLLLADFGHPEPWTASIVRLAMNVAGGLAAILAVRYLWPDPAAPAGTSSF